MAAIPGKAEGACCDAPFECLCDTCIAGACRLDADEDGIPDGDDDCPLFANPDQADADAC
ncbi:hypothetical protein [Sorangium sp. So ce367]|uniref:hypothetical protein n=1 Tax=Sorangium sp. So ce367 TaxID=3133305 RepID=UPI003F631BD4